MRRFFWLIVLVLLVGVLLDRVALTSAAERWERLPAFGPGFVTRAVPLSAEEKDVAFRRLMVGQAGLAILTVIDGTRNRHALHDPLYCIRGAGYQVVAQKRVSLAKGAACQLTLRRGAQTRHVLYWFSDGKTRFTSAPQAWLVSTGRRLTLGYASPAIVLVLLESESEVPLAFVRPCLVL